MGTAFFYPWNKPITAAEKRQPFGPCMKLHLICAGLISFICLWNVFHTPSHGPAYCVVHRWLGRCGMLASLIGLMFGLITAWWERYSDDAMGLAIGLSIVGCLQLYYTTTGYYAIYQAVSNRDNDDIFKEKVAEHKAKMIGLWVSCLSPGWFRIPQMLGASGDSSLMFLGLVPAFFFGPL